MSAPGSSPLARGTRHALDRTDRCIRFIPARAGNTLSPRGGHAEGPVHPRSRGEHTSPSYWRPSGSGSSPLARGTHSPRPPPRRQRRFIPARAGNTGRGRLTSNRTPVHPRSRGEHPVATNCTRPSSGSSPLARGTRRQAGSRRCWRRFIPARAGNTRHRHQIRDAAAVHPRSRGEHAPCTRAKVSHFGSSPLARGTARPDVRGILRTRFIPARAGNTQSNPNDVLPPTVHPRSRGEHLFHASAASALAGSSPLARGTHSETPPRRETHRFIPARAGNTSRASPTPRTRTVHPRSRGEHLGLGGDMELGIGSSPLARGTRRSSCVPGPMRRFIPARAGNTAGGAQWLRYVPVHPRSRGEHSSTSTATRAVVGSSPLARGTHRRRHTETLSRRFIPARAGNTVRGVRPMLAGPVHPRSRGEHLMRAGSDLSPAGSSPLARGTQISNVTGRPSARFIPARAGNTRPPTASPPTISVHPRSRGEHHSAQSRAYPSVGSSPLARGTPGREGQAEAACRFIPARAGNTSPSRTPHRWMPVHPRSRGEHSRQIWAALYPVGSSPLARGTLRPAPACGCPPRFIPARAGNTRSRQPGRRRRPVHPRSRGEHAQQVGTVMGIAGSSPLARGTRR